MSVVTRGTIHGPLNRASTNPSADRWSAWRITGAEPPTPIACTVENFEPNTCRATFACEGGEERSFLCSIATGRETDCKCERPSPQIDVQADGCPADDITTFVNEVCNCDIQVAE